jgi:hypothetical protein
MKHKNELKYPLSEVKGVANKYLYLEDDSIIDVMIATHFANQLDTDPIWLLNIAPSSNAKTELLRAFNDHPNTYFLSNLTASTLISGQKNKNKSNPSLLFSLDGKTLILKDFTTILSMRHEQRQEVIAQLREVYDGSYSKAFGTGETISWNGHVGLIAACTPIYDRYYGVIGTMGDRFLLYRSNNNNTEKMGELAQDTVGQESGMREALKTSVHKFINQLDTTKNIKFKKDETVHKQIVYLACFCAYARCPVDRDSYSRHVLYQPEPEGPARLVKQFTQLGMALAMIHSKNIIDLQTYEIIKRIGRDLISTQRLKILKFLWDKRAFEHLKHWQRTKEISNGVNMPVNTSMLLLEDLMTVGVLRRELEDPDLEKSPYLWQIADQIYKWISYAEVFESSI